VGGSRELVLHGNVDTPTERGHFWGLVCSAKFPRNLAFEKIRHEILIFPRNKLCLNNVLYYSQMHSFLYFPSTTCVAILWQIQVLRDIIRKTTVNCFLRGYTLRARIYGPRRVLILRTQIGYGYDPTGTSTAGIPAIISILGRHLLLNGSHIISCSRSPYAVARPPVVCLSVCLSVCRLSVTLVHPTQAV